MDDRKQSVDPSSPPSSIPNPLVEELAKRLAADEIALAAEFAKPLLSNTAIPGADGPAQTAALAASAFRFLCERHTQPFSLRVFQPVIERDGWTCPGSVVEAALDDQPYVVDTLCETLQELGAEIEVLLNPVVGVERDSTGLLHDIGPAGRLTRVEQLFHAQVTKLERGAEDLLRHRLLQLHRVTEESAAIHQRLTTVAAELGKVRTDTTSEPSDAAPFLTWLGRGNFLFLGHDRHGAAKGAGGTNTPALGILQGRTDCPYEPLGGESRAALTVAKTRARSPIHRLVHMDEVRIAHRDAKGNMIGEDRFVGLFTHKAHSEPAGEIPILHLRRDAVLALDAVGREAIEPFQLAALFDRIPIDHLFGSSNQQLHGLLRTIHTTESRDEIRVHHYRDVRERDLLLTVLMPRVQFSQDTSLRIVNLLRNEIGNVLGEQVVRDERPLVRLHYIVAADLPGLDAHTLDDIEHKLHRALSHREVQIRNTLPPPSADLGREESATSPQRARVAPLASVTSTAAGTDDRIEILPADAANRLHLHLYADPGSMVLSDILPVLQNLGFSVLQQRIEETTENRRAIAVNQFLVQPIGPAPTDLSPTLPLLVETLQAVRAGRLANDPLNALTLRARLPAPAIALLRTYVGYAAQLGIAPRHRLIDVLATHPDYAIALCEIFASKFDPKLPVPNLAQRRRETNGLDSAYNDLVAVIDSAEARQILRHLQRLVAATVRTNFYLNGDEADSSAPVAVKVDSRLIRDVTGPATLFETHIQCAEFEAVFLRASAVARGSIGTVSRLETLRAETLIRLRDENLCRAGAVARAARGGLFLNHTPAGARPAHAEVEQAQRRIVSVLLSIADNVVGDGIAPPRGLIAHDNIDPYLAVSPAEANRDLADVFNEIAIEHEFWLGDSFSTGGSNGFEPRHLGVDNTGAWECARQSLREIDRDLERNPIDTVGIGGPADLRLSPNVRLRAAFNQRHIFLDPDPDPRQAFEERQRLAHQTQVTWNDYAPRRLSRGGGTFSRDARKIELSSEAREMLALGAPTATGNEIAAAILRMQTDLLWCAGRGVSIRDEHEPEAIATCSIGETLTMSASELRARVIIESNGATLTHRARVAFSAAGGRINGALVDGSAAVTLADQEINIKIALRDAINRHELIVDERNDILEAATREVCAQASATCRRNASALGVEQHRCVAAAGEFCDLIEVLEHAGVVDRAAGGLPKREEVRDRHGANRGLYRPELAILAAAAKLELQRMILDSSLCEDQHVQPWIESHFPEPVRERVPNALERHPLRHEIAALAISQRLVDTMGATFAPRCNGLTGRSSADTAKAWAAAAIVGRGEEVLAEIEEEQPGLSSNDEIDARLWVATALEKAALFLLEAHSPEASLAKLVDRFSAPTAEMLRDWPGRLPANRRRRYEQEIDHFTAAGISTDTADSLVRIASLHEVLQICDLSVNANASRAVVGDIFLAIDALLDLSAVETAIDSAGDPQAPGDARARYALHADLAEARRQLIVDVLRMRQSGERVDQSIEEYETVHSVALERVRDLIAKLGTPPRNPFSGALVVVREIGRLSRR
jgi:glutamate dehydrogenase